MPTFSKVHGTRRPGFDDKNGEDNVVQTDSGEIIYPETSYLTGPSNIREM